MRFRKTMIHTKGLTTPTWHIAKLELMFALGTAIYLLLR